MSKRGCMVLRSGAAIAPPERNHHHQARNQKQLIAESHPGVADDEEDEPLVRKRHRIVDPPPSTPNFISAAEQEPPVLPSISAAVEVHSSTPTTTDTLYSIPQQTMMFKFKLPPPIQSVQQQSLQSPTPYFWQQSVPSIQQEQPASLSPSQAPLTLAPHPLQPVMSPKALTSLPLQPAPLHPLQPAPSRSTSKDPKGRVASEEQEHTTGYWRSAKNRALKDWITTDNNYARTRDLQLAKSSGGVSGVYKEAAAFVREKLPYLSEMEFTGQLARRRVEYMAKKVREVIRKTTPTGSGTKDGKTLYQQREALFPGFHELWEVMKQDARFKEAPVLESVVDRTPERDETEDIWDDAQLVEDYEVLDGAKSITSGGLSSKATKPDTAAGTNTLIANVSSTLGTHNISSYFQTRVYELETRIRELEDKCDKWQEKYEKLKDEDCALRVRYEVMRSNIIS